MKIEAGKYYRTHPFEVATVGKADRVLVRASIWYPDGQEYLYDCVFGESLEEIILKERDIIAEWEEPMRNDGALLMTDGKGLLRSHLPDGKYEVKNGIISRLPDEEPEEEPKAPRVAVQWVNIRKDCDENLYLKFDPSPCFGIKTSELTARKIRYTEGGKIEDITEEDA